MPRYLLLRVEDNGDADQLLVDLVLSKGYPLYTPGIKHPVHAELVHCVRQTDQGTLDSGSSVRAILPRIRDSYDRGYELARIFDRESA